MAARKPNLLVLGPTGSGKTEFVVRLAEFATTQRGRVAGCVHVNMAAIPHTLAEGLLFGTEAGIATDVTSRPGKIEEAHGRILFLDEIGHAPRTLQAKLLTVIEKRRVARVGWSEDRSVPVDVWWIAATAHPHRLLSELAFRLGELVIEMPPLVERRDEIPVLANAILRQEMGQFLASEREDHRRFLTIEDVRRLRLKARTNAATEVLTDLEKRLKPNGKYIGEADVERLKGCGLALAINALLDERAAAMDQCMTTADLEELSKRGFSDDAVQYLCERPWPGNVRELRSLIKRAVLMASHKRSALSRDDLKRAEVFDFGPVASRSPEDRLKAVFRGFSDVERATVKREEVVRFLFEVYWEVLGTRHAAGKAAGFENPSEAAEQYGVRDPTKTQ